MMNMPSLLKMIINVFFFVLYLTTKVYALTPVQVFDSVKDSIVVVTTLNAQGEVKSQGSGVLLSSHKIATNCHVVEGGVSYTVKRGKQLVSAILYAEDGDKDICLLDTKGIIGKPAKLGKSTSLKVGKPVYAVGAPRGLELSLSDGIVAQLRGGPPPLIQTTAAISPGSSGGGLFDSDGYLVGLTTLYVEGGQNLNFALPVEWIREVKPGRKTVIKDYRKIEWKKHASALFDMKDWQKMVEFCLKWTEIDEKNDEAWNFLGIAYAKLERYDESIKAINQALRINPENVTYWGNLGATYGNFKQHDEAIKAIDQALRIDPDYADAWFILGNSYSNLTRYGKAIDAYNQTLRIDPDYVDAWYSLGSVYHNLKRYIDAVDAYDKAIRINPEKVQPWFGRGNAYACLGRYNDAIYSYHQAIHINPKDADAWNNLGIAYALSGNRQATLETIKVLRHLDPAKADKLQNLMR